MISLWLIEERLALLPEIGKLVENSLPTSNLLEEKISYGPHPQQYIHLCMPKNPAARRCTTVFFLHGGGWNSGNPTLFRFIGHFFARKGYPTLLGGYRLAPDFHYPAQIEDMRSGLRCGLQALAARGVPVKKVVVGGQSAGAHLASLLVYNQPPGDQSIKDTDLIGGLFAISGPLNFAYCANPALHKMLADLFGEVSDWNNADPIRLIRGDEHIPALFIHGRRDPLVDVQNSISFAAALAESRSCPVEIHLVRGGHHADLVDIFLHDSLATRVLVNWLGQLDQP